MRCIVTAGPTYEPLDRVRRITNFSTGGLGTALASQLAAAGNDVLMFRGETATCSAPMAAVKVETFTTTADLASLFLKYASDDAVAIFQVAAVSDFAFGPVYERRADGRLSPIYAGKISTREGSLWVELKPTPKILSGLREWFPRGRIVGWKYEVDGVLEDVVRKARQQLIDCRSDACVANGPAHGPGFSLVTQSEIKPCLDQAQLFTTLLAWLRNGV